MYDVRPRLDEIAIAHEAHRLNDCFILLRAPAGAPELMGAPNIVTAQRLLIRAVVMTAIRVITVAATIVTTVAVSTTATAADPTT
jgi:hypothetical protein